MVRPKVAPWMGGGCGLEPSSNQDCCAGLEYHPVFTCELWGKSVDEGKPGPTLILGSLPGRPHFEGQFPSSVHIQEPQIMPPLLEGSAPGSKSSGHKVPLAWMGSNLSFAAKLPSCVLEQVTCMVSSNVSWRVTQLDGVIGTLNGVI